VLSTYGKIPMTQWSPAPTITSNTAVKRPGVPVIFTTWHLRGRHKKEATRLIHERIVEAVELRPEDDLVDIGCGHGTLLRMAQQAGVRSALGILATEEEVSLVRRTGVQVRQGFTDQLPIADASASVVVCNNVLLIVAREKIPASLLEICRIARPGARIFIGEIPFAEQHDPTPRFRTRGETLSYLYREHGLGAWFGMARRMLWWRLTGQPEEFVRALPSPFLPRRRSLERWPKAQAWNRSAIGSITTPMIGITTCCENRCARKPSFRKRSEVSAHPMR
jgi:SAM-dependent methyltransferase